MILLSFLLILLAAGIIMMIYGLKEIRKERVIQDRKRKLEDLEKELFE